MRRALTWLSALVLVAVGGCAASRRPPNVVLIMTDDLGYGELGCYGQVHIRTPNIDALAREGVRWTQFYSGSCVALAGGPTHLTGRHTGHCAIRDNRELQPEGQEPLPREEVTLASLLRARGYATAAIGKWGLGPPGSEGDPSRHGFDLFFGYLCQRHAHNHCPPYIYRNAEHIALDGNTPGNVMGPVYAPDLMRAEAESFIRSSAERPFFLLYATPVPHVALQVPEESLQEYRGAFQETPYEGAKGYLPHAEPRTAYAAMVSRMDRDVGSILSLIDELGLREETIVIFTSDNGPTWAGGADSAFFESTSGLRGLKGNLYEGGIRVPLIIRWPGVAGEGLVTSQPAALWDLFPTLARACGIRKLPPGLDGEDLGRVLDGRARSVNRRGDLYWEYPSGKGWQAARIGDFKIVRRSARVAEEAKYEVFDLASDPFETNDLAAQRPDIVAQAKAVLARRTTSRFSEWEMARP